MTTALESNAKTSWKTKPLTKVPSSERRYSSDDLIDAYLKGIKRQSDRERQLLIDTFGQNLSLAKEIGESFYKLLNSLSIPCHLLSIKAQDIFSFEILIAVPQKNYLSKKFDKVYVESIKEQNKRNNDNFTISFHFMPYKKNVIDENKIVTDGFNLSYAP